MAISGGDKMVRILKFVGALAAITCGLGMTQAAAQATTTIGDWFASCDNLRACSAYGFSSSQDPVFLRFERGGEAGAEPRWSIGWSLDDPPAGTKVKLSFDDPALAGLPGEPVTIEPDKSPIVFTVPPGDDAAFLASLRKAQVLRLERVRPPGAKGDDPSGDKVEVSLKGAVAILIWLDDRQKRLETVTAMIRRGAKPASAVPDVPSEPVLKAAAPVPPGRLPTQQPAAIARALKAADCETNLSDEMAKPSIDRLSPSAVLWGATCIAGAYNHMVYYFVVEQDKVRPALFETPSGSSGNGGAPNELANADFDPKTMTMSAFDKGRGVGDCGTSGRWVWDGRAFRLLEFSDMPECKGIESDAWPVVFRARRAK